MMRTWPLPPSHPRCRPTSCHAAPPPRHSPACPTLQEKYAAALDTAPAAAAAQRAVYHSNRAAALLKLEQWTEAVQVRWWGSGTVCQALSCATRLPAPHAAACLLPRPGGSACGSCKPRKGCQQAPCRARLDGRDWLAKQSPHAASPPAGVQRGAGAAAGVHKGVAAALRCLREAG